jgi:hypothetical protein
MWFVVNLFLGAVLAAGFVAAARTLGRAETFIYLVVLLCAALAYVGLGLGVRAPAELVVECLGVALFVVLGVAGVLRSLWYLCLGWALHGVWDLIVPGVADVSYMPAWYMPACAGFDLVMAVYLGSVAVKNPSRKEERMDDAYQV